MKIEAITLREIHLPLVHFFETSFHRLYHRRILLVTAHAEGVEGWGESVVGEDPYYSSEWIDSAWPTMTQYLIPALLGQKLESGRECTALFARVRSHRMAKAALENAVWDAEAHQKQQPLWKLLGGTRREIACGVSIGIQDTPEQLLEKIETELAAGYRRIKIKVKPGWDLNVLEKIRSRWADIVLSVDANSAYTLDQVEQFARRAAKPVEFCDQHHVTGLQGRHQLRQLRPIGPGAADFLPEYRVGAGRLQRLQLARIVLILRTDPRVSDGGHIRAPFCK